LEDPLTTWSQGAPAAMSRARRRPRRPEGSLGMPVGRAFADEREIGPHEIVVGLV
jgi:hypothetical protein